MHLTVETPDAQSAMTLVQRLVNIVGGEAVSMAASGDEVRVDAPDDDRRTLVETLDSVEAWLSDAALDHARINCDGHTYTLER